MNSDITSKQAMSSDVALKNIEKQRFDVAYHGPVSVLAARFAGIHQCQRKALQRQLDETQQRLESRHDRRTDVQEAKAAHDLAV